MTEEGKTVDINFETVVKFIKTTRHTYVYGNEIFPGIYIPKSILKDNPPQELTLNICDAGYTIPKEV